MKRGVIRVSDPVFHYIAYMVTRSLYEAQRNTGFKQLLILNIMRSSLREHRLFFEPDRYLKY